MAHRSWLQIVLLALATALPASAQPWAVDGQIRFRQLDVMNLSFDLTVDGIFQDDIGFLWFGTEDGLLRVDGYDVRAYRPIPFDSTSVSDPWVNSFAGAGPAAFWVATQSGGLARYDAMRDAFDRFPDVAPARLNGIAVDEDSVLWLASNSEGLVRFDPVSGESERITGDPDVASSLPSDQLNAVLSSRDGSLWVATVSGGLCRFDRASRTCRTYRHDPRDATSIPGDRVQAMLEDAAGRLWVGTFGGGVARFDDSTNGFTRYTVQTGTNGDNVLALLELPDGAILVGLDAGLIALDPESGEQTLYRHAPGNPTSIAAGTVYSLYLDRNKIVWIGTDTGVSYFPATPPRFQHYTHEPDNANSLSHRGVWSIYEDEVGMLWVGTTAGLNRIDRDSGVVTRYFADPSDPTRLATGLVMGITRTRDGSFWVATRRGGLHRFDRETGHVLERYTEVRRDSTSLKAEIPWWILEDSRGQTWITSGGAGCLHRMLEPGVFARHCHDPDDPNTPAHDFARQLIEGRDGSLWLGTWGGGLDRIDPVTHAVTHFQHNPRDRNSVPSDFVIAVREDGDGVLWLGTYGGGFSRFDPATGAFTHYNANNSELPSDAVYEIQIDARGRLWLSTNAGLVRFDPSSEAFLFFGPEDGIQDLEFNSGASFQSPSGELFFGGPNGVNAFFPDDIEPVAAQPRVVMTSLQAGGQDIRPGPDAPITVALPYARRIRLGPDQRDVAITFAAIQNRNPAHMRYRYRLDGHDDDWRPAGRARTATYSNLEPGSHQFVVAASGGDGTWNENALTVDVIVTPLFRETLWAKLLLGLFLVGLGAAFYRYRRNRLVLQHRLELEHIESQKLRDLDRTRSVFFANVSHEFRTPLTLTIGPIDDIIAGQHGEVSEATREQLSLARRNASRVLDLTNQILDLARLEAGRTRMRIRHVDLNAFVGQATEIFAPLAKKKAIAFDVEYDGFATDIWADPVQLEKVLFNLLSNAFKFTPGGGTIKVRVENNADNVRLSVRDNGPGIPASDVPFVFDRFHQAKESSAMTQPGTGIGLALAREIVEKHCGAIAVTSEEGFGSTFSVSLRRGRDHFAPEQIDESPLEPVDGTRTEPPFAAPEVVDTVDATNGDESLDSEDLTTVLIVEDHPDGRAYIRFHLQQHYRVIEASNGVQGLDLARRLLPDVVVSDVMMPEMDGFALCHALKADRETNFIPVVLLTARAAQEDRMEGLREQADDYLTKPFDPEELRLRIANLVARGEHLKQRFAESSSVVRHVERPAGAPGLQSADDIFLERLGSIVDARLADDEFSVEQLAEDLGLSRTQLFRNVRRIVDQSPSEIIRSQRLERAAIMLSSHAGNVSEVAYATGFKSLSHFSRCFTQRFGCPPSAYAERSPTTPGA